jgi:uncharacterized membrane protein (DUF373 family)
MMKDRITWTVEATVIMAMQVLVMVIVIAASFLLFVLLGKNLFTQAAQIESISTLLPAMQQSFAGVLIVVLGLELLETLKAYFAEHHVRLEVILAVAIIAVARHLLQIDFAHTPGTVLLGIAAVILALTSGYFLIKKTHVELTGAESRSR